MVYFIVYNQSRFKIFLVSIFFLFFILSCNNIQKEGEEKPSSKIRAGNAQAASSIKTGKLPSGLHDSKSNGYVKNQIIVKFAKGTSKKIISHIQKELHLETLRTFSSPDLFLMKITDHTPVKKIQKSLKKYKEVEYSEPNYFMSIDSKKGGKP
jgi:hypothetical protein